jgi:hypothetical protein
MEIARLVLEYLNTLAWPAVVCLVLAAFRRHVTRLLPKLTSIEAGGFSATFDSVAEQAMSLGTAATDSQALKPSIDRLAMVKPSSYVSARDIGTNLAAGTPVLLDLQEIAEADAKRLIDFCAGVTFVTAGAIRKVGYRQYLVTAGTK